jgi:hypothetical protein
VKIPSAFHEAQRNGRSAENQRACFVTEPFSTYLVNIPAEMPVPFRWTGGVAWKRPLTVSDLSRRGWRRGRDQDPEMVHPKTHVSRPDLAPCYLQGGVHQNSILKVL